jgi:putative N6-adenine-specific DNA methylase
LEQEVRDLGCVVHASHETGIEVAGNLRDAMRLCLWLRTALHVLYLVGDFPCRTADQLYEATVRMPWEDMIPADGYVTVVSNADTPAIDNTMFASQRTKDGIVDRISRRRGRRPDSGPERDRAVVHLFWKKDRAWLYLGTSGAKLSDRGYRKIPLRAPLRESLAAGLLMAAGYDGRQPLVTPMCGSGTLAVEGAWMALCRAPGLLRQNFGFMHLVGYDPAAWQSLRQEARQRGRRALPAAVIASDIAEDAVAAARANAAAAGVEGLIRFEVCDFADTPIPDGRGIVIMNPEYGERLGETKALETTYARIGDFLKQKCVGYRGYVFTGNPDLAKKIGLRFSRRIRFYNARIECRLLEYELYAGARPKRPTQESSPGPQTPPEGAP